MTLEDINYVAQTVGVVAILGTFVAVLIQMRQTNRLLRKDLFARELQTFVEALPQPSVLRAISARLREAATSGDEI